MLTAELDLNFIQADAVILTPNRRLAAFLAAKHQLQQVAKGNQVWESAAIYPLQAWCEKLWLDLICQQRAPQKLLSPIQLQIIWEKIILASKVGSGLLEIVSTAKQAINAWDMMLQYDLSFTAIAAGLEWGSDPLILQLWAAEYQQQCSQHGWLDFYSMLNVLIAEISAHPCHLPSVCYLIEQQELTPQYQRLFAALKQHGTKIVEQQLMPKRCQDIAVLSVADEETEYLRVANWALASWQTDSTARVGVVVPDLAQSRDKVEAAFATAFAAAKNNTLSCLSTELPYNISAPHPLSYYGIIDLALLLLQLSGNVTISCNDLTKLLRSSFIAGASPELNGRAMFAQQMLNTGELEFALPHVLAQLQILAASGKVGCSLFATNWESWLALAPQLTGMQSTQYWLAQFAAILQSWGWPGSKPLSANEQQLLSCWQLLLQEYGQLDFILQRHSFHAACKIVQKLALHTPFLPETGEVSIHVLGILEAAGLPFAKLWVLGMHSNAWPMAAAPNPFLPVHIQRQFNLPRSSAARELMVAEALTATFCRGASGQVVFSFAETVAEIPRMPSRLLIDFPRQHQLLPAISTSKVAAAFQPRINMQHLQDGQGPAFIKDVAPGGSKTLQLQANCPFWAFAEIRLRARQRQGASIGLTARERGTLLHNVLANVWRQLQTSAALLALAADKSTQLLTHHINTELQALQKLRPLTLTENYIALETKRMLQLLGKWLQYERQRQPFVVYKIEQQYLAQIGALKFNVQLDRIDQLLSGEIVVLDYKTGTVATNDWFKERIYSPQLPLYCVATPLNPSCVAFAIIRTDSKIFKGVAQTTKLLPDVATLAEMSGKGPALSWEQQITSWQDKLAQVALEFQQGQAQVQPAAGNATCRNCKLQTFCRIHEKTSAL